MRALASSVLPPGGHVVFRLDPPLDRLIEKVYVVTVRGPTTAVVDDADPSAIVVVNPTQKIAPLVFFVGPIEPSSLFRQAILKLLKR